MSAAPQPIIAIPSQPAGERLSPKTSTPKIATSTTPDDYGKVKVAGEITSLSPQHIAIRRCDDLAGEVVVHFPRAVFLVTLV